MFEEGAEVTVTGAVAAEDPIRAPLTGECCVLHRTHLRISRLVGYAGRPLRISR